MFEPLKVHGPSGRYRGVKKLLPRPRICLLMALAAAVLMALYTMHAGACAAADLLS